jgi:hypothetical protein
MQEVQRDVASVQEDQVTEPRVAAMFREIQAGQELVNSDQLDRVQ